MEEEQNNENEIEKVNYGQTYGTEVIFYPQSVKPWTLVQYSPVADLGNEVTMCEQGKESYWSVYLKGMDGLFSCIADVPSKQMALSLVELIRKCAHNYQPMPEDEMKKMWDFIEKYYPNYYTSEDVALVLDLEVILEGGASEGSDALKRLKTMFPEEDPQNLSEMAQKHIEMVYRTRFFKLLDTAIKNLCNN